MEVVGETHGTMHMRVSDFPHQSLHPQPASPFILPDEMECWPIAMPPRGNAVLFVHHESGIVSINAAWRLLIAHGTAVASTHGIMPQDVILGKVLVSLTTHCSPPTQTTVTRSLRVNDHQIDDWTPSSSFGMGHSMGFGAPGGFGGGSMGFPHHGFAPPMPTIVYLVTSSRPDFAAYLTDNPMGRPRPRATRSTSWCFNCRFGWYVPLLCSKSNWLIAFFFWFQSGRICQLHSIRCRRCRLVASFANRTTHTYPKSRRIEAISDTDSSVVSLDVRLQCKYLYTDTMYCTHRDIRQSQCMLLRTTTMVHRTPRGCT